MRSLILTLLYLAKDTLHRWITHVSSPLARLLVVFFLTLCALFFLGSYVISTKIIRSQLQRQGANTIATTLSQASQIKFPNEEKTRELLQVDSWVLRNLGFTRDSKLKSIAIFSYDFNRSAQCYPLLVRGKPTLLCTPSNLPNAGIRSLKLNNIPFALPVHHISADHPLMRQHNGRIILIPPHIAKQLASPSQHKRIPLYIALTLQDKHISKERIQEVELYLRNFSQLAKRPGFIHSAARLLGNLDNLLGNQQQTRAIFSLGITFIVGILLTALASMEYRQNEYIYTLLKSFGIHPLMLVFTFIIENIILVGIAFIAAIFTFIEAQRIILSQFFKQSGHILKLEDIMPELQLIGAALLICVLLSAIPILIAANREIGRVLK